MKEEFKALLKKCNANPLFYLNNKLFIQLMINV